METPRFPHNPVEGTMGAGLVTVRALIDTDGRVRLAIPLRGSEQMRASALKAAMRSRFKPATVGGAPVAVWVCIPYNFRFVG